MNRKQKRNLIRILAAAVLMVLLFFLPVSGPLRFALYMLPYLVVGYDVLLEAAHGIRNRQPFDECFLMAVATIGAIALGEYSEGVAVMLFYQIGELFQSFAVDKSRKSIGELMDIRPDRAVLAFDDGHTEEVSPDEVPTGSSIVVKPGEKIPLDGIVLEGHSTLDTAALTGESLPRDVAQGDEVLSGCVNLSGLLYIRTTKEFEESTASRILEMVENASSLKSRSEAFITRFARVYTPAVCFSALAVAILPPVIRMVLGMGADWGIWVYRALTFLVISCPCALVVSIPLTFFAGIGGASRAGVLVKGSNYLEALANTETLLMDKTGTLTAGTFSVQEISPVSLSAETLLEYAALAESYSVHPISRSLQEACPVPVDSKRVSEVREISGHGVTALLDEKIRIAAGNDKLMAQLGIPFTACEKPGTVIYLAVDGCYAGYILITDTLKPTAKRAIQALRKTGVKELILLTGDETAAAEAVGTELEMDTVFSRLLPQDKVTKVEEVLARSGRTGTVAFTGDGINDAPVLSRADVGIAMGALGSDAAIEAADIVLMDDDPLKIPLAIGIARRCLRIVRENIVFSIGVKLLCLLLSAFGIVNMWGAIFADVGVMVLAVLNAIRALKVKI